MIYNDSNEYWKKGGTEDGTVFDEYPCIYGRILNGRGEGTRRSQSVYHL